MNISALNTIRKYLGYTVLAGTMTFGSPAISSAQNNKLVYQPLQDEVVIQPKITPKGVKLPQVLSNAPSPEVVIKGEAKLAAIVVDLSKNVLYRYDELGNPQEAYLVASGRASSPTQKGVRVVSHIESYPYNTAPATTRRYNHPADYGPNILCLQKLDPKTGVKSPTGQFIHGNHNANSLGKYASLGCIRMDNEVIKKFAKIIKRGAIVIIK